MTSKGFAPAKINLTLHVTGQRADGYHLLDSLVVFADIGDRLAFAPQGHLSVDVSGPFADGVPMDSRNLVWRAAELAGQTAAITLEKNLPHGAGIGGGSSDAAAVLRQFDYHGSSTSLGADVPVCIAARAQRMQGIGDVLNAVPDLPALWAVLANPAVHVPTPVVFEALTCKSNLAMPKDFPRYGNTAELINWLRIQRNDLELPALHAAPQIARVLDVLRDTGGIQLGRMSGSGSTCFGLCETAKDAHDAAKVIAQHHPEWWVQPCQLS